MINTDESTEIASYYNQAIKFANSHYENFPVVSFFFKKEIRKYVAAIYQFARQADDIADEGNLPDNERIDKLNIYQSEFDKCLKQEFESGFWQIIYHTIKKKQLTSSYFADLLTAFKQDIFKNRYQNFDELLDYCKNSANPVGRLILELHNIRAVDAKQYSDKVCTALQLANFYQDVSIDIKKDRIYIPIEEMHIFNVEESDFIKGDNSQNFVKLMKYQIERTKRIFTEGRELLQFLPIKLKFQILLTIKGGEKILRKIEEINYNVLNIRPTLSKIDVIKIFLGSLILWR